MLPSGEKAAVRQLSNGICVSCKGDKETIKHLCWEYPRIKELARQVCKWFHKKFKVPFFKRDLVLGPKTL